jgi:hypothetical protein
MYLELITRIDMVFIFGSKSSLRSAHQNKHNFLIRSVFLTYNHSNCSEKIDTHDMFYPEIKVGRLPYLTLLRASPQVNALDGSNKHQQFIEILTKKTHMMRTLSPSHHDRMYLWSLQI